ncbi:MAG: hypothetical protein CMH64_04360 [Nanoarchaeota archaeon]|mgnify:CR=1 FL=1|nr:hypothetical protein [Nanoarchaeota archaeon]|tara:strand:+ start:139 stop:378 length:240 start_codon:yes stop_codon:yes gene_type:complete
MGKLVDFPIINPYMDLERLSGTEEISFPTLRRAYNYARRDYLEDHDETLSPMELHKTCLREVMEYVAYHRRREKDETKN